MSFPRIGSLALAEGVRRRELVPLRRERVPVIDGEKWMSRGPNRNYNRRDR